MSTKSRRYLKKINEQISIYKINDLVQRLPSFLRRINSPLIMETKIYQNFLLVRQATNNFKLFFKPTISV